MVNVKCVNPWFYWDIETTLKWLIIAIKTVNMLAYSSNEKQEKDTYSFKTSATVNMDNIIIFETKWQHSCPILLMIISIHFIQCSLFKRQVWIDRKMAATNLEIVKILTLHIGLGMEITMTLFLILLNSNKFGKYHKSASVIFTLLSLIQSPTILDQ